LKAKKPGLHTPLRRGMGDHKRGGANTLDPLLSRLIARGSSELVVDRLKKMWKFKKGRGKGEKRRKRHPRVISQAVLHPPKEINNIYSIKVGEKEKKPGESREGNS